MKCQELRFAGYLGVVLLGLSGASAAFASAPLLDSFGGPLGFGENCLYHNDDGSSNGILLVPEFEFGLQFFSESHDTVFVNTNGNITFSGPFPGYTPYPFPVADRPMIAPYWADVDTRFQDGECDGEEGYSDIGDLECQNPSENGIWWHKEPGLFVVTWDRVGYYDCNVDRRMSFQLILREVDQHGCGDFDVEFRYNLCEWTTGEASANVGAQAGFDAGDRVNHVEIPGSRSDQIHEILCNQSNVGEPGVWRFDIRGGVIEGCEGAGEPCDTGLHGVCAEGVKRCVGSTTDCVPIMDPGPEMCSGLDEDCDGVVDNGEELCGPYFVCHQGACVAPCLEFGCLDDYVCVDTVCLEPDCVDVTCPVGTHCREGECVDPCDGVICPHGQVCRGTGHCLDVCYRIACDHCSVCVDGSCQTHCEWEACPEGKTCQPDGSCVEDACATRDCQDGFYCEGGVCIDACEGARCPYGQICRAGNCEPMTETDVEEGGGYGPIDSEDETGLGPGDRGCGCAAQGPGSISFLLASLLLAGGGALAVRRRGFGS